MHEADRGRMQLIAIIAMASIVVGTGASRETSLAGQGRVGATCPDSPAAVEPFATVLGDSGKIYRGTFAPAGDEPWFFKKVSAARPGGHAGSAWISAASSRTST